MSKALMNDVILELQEYTELDGTEWADTAWALINLYQKRGFLSSKLNAAIEKEIRDWLEYVKKNAVIAEETVTPTPYAVKVLNWT